MIEENKFIAKIHIKIFFHQKNFYFFLFKSCPTFKNVHPSIKFTISKITTSSSMFYDKTNKKVKIENFDANIFVGFDNLYKLPKEYEEIPIKF